MIPCEHDLTSTPFCDTIIITNEIELPPSVNKFGFNQLDDDYFIIPYITDTIPNLRTDHQISAQAKKNVWIIDKNGEDPIKDQDALA